MFLYMVSYDIPKRDDSLYEPMWSYLGSIKGRKILYSQWIVPHPGPAETLLKEIKEKVKVKPEERLIVQRVMIDMAGFGAFNLGIAIDALVEGLKRSE